MVLLLFFVLSLSMKATKRKKPMLKILQVENRLPLASINTLLIIFLIIRLSTTGIIVTTNRSNSILVRLWREDDSLLHLAWFHLYPSRPWRQRQTKTTILKQVFFSVWQPRKSSVLHIKRRRLISIKLLINFKTYYTDLPSDSCERYFNSKLHRLTECLGFQDDKHFLGVHRSFKPGLYVSRRVRHHPNATPSFLGIAGRCETKTARSIVFTSLQLKRISFSL